MSGVPQRSSLGLVLLYIFVGHKDSGTECILSKSVDDTKQCSAVNILDERHFDPEGP